VPAAVSASATPERAGAATRSPELELQSAPPGSVPQPQPHPPAAAAAAVSAATAVPPDAGPAALESRRDSFPIDFDLDFDDSWGAAITQAPPELQGSEWPAEAVSPEAAAAQVTALVAPADSPATFAERERDVYQNLLPSLHSVKAVRAAATRVLHALQEDRTSGAVEDSSARMLIYRRLLDMCEEVERAQGLDECPETELSGGTHTSVLSSMHRACPLLDMTCQGPSLVDEVLRCADADAEAVPRLVQAVAGVEVLKEVGLSPSRVALHAAGREVRRRTAEADAPGASDGTPGLAAIVLWLSPADAASLLVATMNDAAVLHSLKLEVLGHVRAANGARRQSAPREEEAVQTKLHEVMLQAEALMLLASVHRAGFSGQEALHLQLDADVSFQIVRARWLHELAAAEETAAFAPCAEAALADVGVGRV